MNETNTLEFKESVTKSFLKTVSAFANDAGGTIVFGVNDNGVTVGMENPDAAALDVENAINDSIVPRPRYELKVNRCAGTVTLKVYEGFHKPYLYHAKAYTRQGSATVEADAFQLRRLLLEGQRINYEELPAHSQDLTFGILESRLQEHLGIQAVTTDVLKTLELYSDKEGFNLAAEILADANSMPYLDIVRFGKTISVMRERIILEGSSCLLQLEEAMKVFRRCYCYEEISGLTREERQSIPEEAFREALVNAIVHRAWDVQANIRVAMWDDRIEVTSPGGLPKGVTEEEYLSGHLSVLRNPILGNVFFRLGQIERLGTGVRRIREAYEGTGQSPVFTVSTNAIAVELPVLGSVGLQKDEQIVYATLKGNVLKSSVEVAEEAGFGKTKTVRLLQALQEKGLVRVAGAGRGTRYALA